MDFPNDLFGASSALALWGRALLSLLAAAWITRAARFGDGRHAASRITLGAVVLGLSGTYWMEIIWDGPLRPAALNIRAALGTILFLTLCWVAQSGMNHAKEMRQIASHFKERMDSIPDEEYP